MTDAKPPSRSRWQRLMRRVTQFRLRSLLILIAVVAIVSATVGRHYYLQHLRAAAVEAITNADGHALNDSGLIVTQGDAINRVLLSGITDEKLRDLIPHLAVLPSLRELDIVDSTVTDKGLEGLEHLDQLETLIIFNTEVTSQGLAMLGQRVPQLQIREEKPNPVATGLAMRPIYGHAITAMAVSPNRRLLAVGDGRGQLRLWKLDSLGLPDGQPRTLPAHADWLFDVAFSSDGQRLVTGGGDNRIVIWETATLRELKEFDGHTDDVHAVAFAQDDQKLVSTGDDMTVRIWDVASGQQEHVLTGHNDTIPSLAVSPDGHTVATGSRDGTIRVWQIGSGQLIEVLEGHTADVLSVRFAPADDRLISASYDHTIRIWDTASALPIREFTHDDWVFTGLVTSQGELISGGREGILRRWDADSERLLAEHKGQGNISRIVATSDEMLAVASAEGRIRFWDRDLIRCLATVRIDLERLP